MNLQSKLLTAVEIIGLAPSVQLYAEVTRPVGINISYVADYYRYPLPMLMVVIASIIISPTVGA